MTVTSVFADTGGVASLETGVGDFGDLVIVDTTAFDPTRTFTHAYASPFDKATEIQQAGRYAVELEWRMAKDFLSRKLDDGES